MKKILLLVLVSVLSSVMLFGCKKSETAAADTLIVGTNAEFPPFESLVKKLSLKIWLLTAF